jgi:CHAT domain-containing protein/TPR repeat protein
MEQNRDRLQSEGEDSQEYANFLLELLQAEADSNRDIKVIYPILAERQHLLNASFAETLQQVAQTFIAQHPEAIKLIVADIENLSIDIYQFPRGSRANNIEIAIAGYQIVLNNRQPGIEKFAQTQYNLAIAYYSRINGSRAENLERAIFYYQEALKVRTRDAFPQDWATTQHNLAAAYYSRITGEKAENIEWAIAFFKAALPIRTRNDFPKLWAETQNNLGEAYRHRIRGQKADNIEQAITFYNAALEVYTSDDFPKLWAETQNNLGEAYRERISGEKADNIEQAITFYNAALEVFTRDAFPEYWATTQNNLAIAYCQRIREKKADNIEQAIAAYNLVLQISTREHFPLENVETLNNLGWAYLAKIDHINQEKLEDKNQKAATLQSAYDTFKKAITGATELRKLESQNEVKQKHDLQWDRLYKGMVQVCLDRASNQEALEYAEANKARNLAELIAQKQEIPKTLTPITFSQITQLLTPNTALIEWYITDEEIITFVVTYPDVLTVHRHRQWHELIYLVTEYRAAYKTSKTDWQKQLATWLQRLAGILQITTILPPSSTRLILIPHWLLHLFPLHALPLTDGEFLLDKYLEGIQYAPSCQLLQQITIHPNFDQLLALQNPTSDLRYTDLEVASIAPKFALSQILSGDEASKTNLLEKYLDQLENAHCAHFSCHGSFNPDDPLKSFLILSGGIVGEEPPQPPLLRGEQEEEVIKVPLSKGDLGGSDRYVEWRAGKTADINNCLTLADILLLQFKDCRLVVLSACETALIDTNNRSDYIGLPTGFIHAGAMGTLASLWAVNDLSTALMMVKFYELLKPGVSIGKALHDTQRWFKSAATSDLLSWVQESDSFDGDRKEYTEELLGRYKEDEKPYSDVYHWAAFCAIGL